MSWLALLIYAGWTLALVAAIAGLRATYALTGKHPTNGFSPTGDDVSAFSGRLCRAHANCYENLPIVTAVIAAAALTGHGAVTDPLAIPLVGARIAQSLVHLWSTSVAAVTIRFTLFATQLVIIGYWVVSLGFAM